METRSASSLLRSATAAAAAVGLSAAGLWAFWLAGAGSLTAVRASGPDAAEDLLVLGAAGVGAVLLAWLGLGVTLSALSAAPGAVGRLATAAAEHVAPAAVRRLTAAVLGAAIATAATPAAHADSPFPAPPLTPTTSQTAPAPDPAFGITVRAPVVDAVPDPGTTTGPRRDRPRPRLRGRHPDRPRHDVSPRPVRHDHYRARTDVRQGDADATSPGTARPCAAYPVAVVRSPQRHRGPWRQPLGHRGAAPRAAGDAPAGRPRMAALVCREPEGHRRRTRTSSASARC